MLDDRPDEAASGGAARVVVLYSSLSHCTFAAITMRIVAMACHANLELE